MMDERNYQGAVDMFSHSLDLVFSENLVAFHAITGIRNALMECKQTIEDRLVHELKHLIYMKVRRAMETPSHVMPELNVFTGSRERSRTLPERTSTRSHRLNTS